MPRGKSTIPGARHCPIVLPKGLVQLHAAPLALGKVCLPHVPHHASLRPANLLAHRQTQVQRMQWAEAETGTSHLSLPVCKGQGR